MMHRIILRQSNGKHPIYAGLCASGACGRTTGDAPTHFIYVLFLFQSNLYSLYLFAIVTAIENTPIVIDGEGISITFSMSTSVDLVASVMARAVAATLTVRGFLNSTTVLAN